jgi:hypothetical protein
MYIVVYAAWEFRAALLNTCAVIAKGIFLIIYF